MKYYYCSNPRLENYLSLNGIYPVKYSYDGKTAYYEITTQFSCLLESFYIKYDLLKTRYYF